MTLGFLTEFQGLALKITPYLPGVWFSREISRRLSFISVSVIAV